MSDRRSVLIVLGVTALAPRAVFAQAKRAPVLIGWLHSESRGSRGHHLAAFKEGLAALGWKEGSQIVIEERWAEGRRERLQPLAEELAARKPALIVAAPLSAVSAASKAAPNTPIVIGAGSDPVALGIVTSLARPGGMITGTTSVSPDVSGKFLELLLAAAPKARRVGFLLDSAGVMHARHLENARRAAGKLAVEARFEGVAKPEELERVIARLEREGTQALVVMPSTFLTTERRQIVKLALARRWPMIAANDFAEAGALLTYGVVPSEQYRRAAYYADRILNGTKPGDLPIELPTKLELVINLKTAKAIGLTIPQELLLRADKVIE